MTGKTLKPEKVPYFAYNIFAYLLLGLFGVFALWAWLNLSFPTLLIIFVTLQVLGIYSISVSYKKQKFIIKSDKIIEKSGGIFSDSEKELNIRNITHLQLTLGYIEQKLFQTGSVTIESAGSNFSEIGMSSMSNAVDIYEKMQELMVENGFQIQRKEVLTEDKPDKTAVLVQLAINSLFWIGGFVFSLVALGPLSIFVLMIAAVALVFNYYSLIKKEYKLYQGSINYSENFLTKVRAVVPIENLSDTGLNQNIFSRALGVYDLTLSCQGSGQEIKFKNIKKGEEFDTQVDKLIRTGEATSLETQKRRKTTKQKGEENKKSDIKTGLNSVADKFKDIRKDGTRALAVPAFLILFGLTMAAISAIWFISGGIDPSRHVGFVIYPFIFGVTILFSGVSSAVRSAVNLYAMKYSVKEHSIREEYKFLSKDMNEFSDDKITGVYFKENLIDRLFNTYSIHFWSLGSGSDIEFAGIKKDSDLDNLIRKKFDYNKPSQHKTKPDFNFVNMLKQKTLSLVVWAFIFSAFTLVSLMADALTGFPMWWISPVAIISLAVVWYFAAYAYGLWYYDRVELDFCSNYLHLKQGLITKYQYFAHYDDVRGIVTTKYPLTEHGRIKFKVSGEQVTQTDKGKRINTNDFSVDYIPNIPVKDELVDLILEKKISEDEIDQVEQNIEDYREEKLLTTKPSVANPATVAIIFSIILFPLLPFLPFYLGYVVWSAKKKTFIIEPYRLVKKWGILYKKQQSIVFRKIDHINKEQGMFNKLFNNGTVTINTVESSTTEMTLGNMPDYEEFYEKLKKLY